MGLIQVGITIKGALRAGKDESNNTLALTLLVVTKVSRA